MANQGMTGTFRRIVAKAAAILDQEVAASSLHTAPQRGVDYARTGTPSPDLPWQQLGQQAQALIMMLYNLFAAAQNPTRTATRGSAVNPAGPASAEPGPETAPVLSSPAPVKAGDMVQLTVTLQNDDAATPSTFGLACTDLVAGADRRIPASHVTLMPNTLCLLPASMGDVVMRVAVPASTPPGLYAGLLQATELSYLRAVVTVRVA